MLTADMLKLLNDTSKTRRKRAIKKDPLARWKNGVVPYHIDRKLSKFSYNILRFLQEVFKRADI